MSKEPFIVVYCDGREKRRVKHDATPLAAYRRQDGQWHVIHTAVFRGESVETPASGLQHLVGDQAQSNKIYDAGTIQELAQQMTADAQRRLNLSGQLGVDQRSQYQWKCDICEIEVSPS